MNIELTQQDETCVRWAFAEPTTETPETRSALGLPVFVWRSSESLSIHRIHNGAQTTKSRRSLPSLNLVVWAPLWIRCMLANDEQNQNKERAHTTSLETGYNGMEAFTYVHLMMRVNCGSCKGDAHVHNTLYVYIQYRYYMHTHHFNYILNSPFHYLSWKELF